MQLLRAWDLRVACGVSGLGHSRRACLSHIPVPREPFASPQDGPLCFGETGASPARVCAAVGTLQTGVSSELVLE